MLKTIFLKAASLILSAVMLSGALPSAASEIGQVTGGYSNGGSMAFCGGSALFIQDGTPGCCSEDGLSEVADTIQRDSYLNLCDNCAYWLSDSSIYRMNLETGEYIPIFSFEPECVPDSLLVQDGYLYCTRGSEITVCRFGDENAEFSTVADDMSQLHPGMCMLGGRLYYSSNDGIISCKPDGSGRTLISKHPGSLFTDGESIFIGSESFLIKLKPDGSEQFLLKVQSLVNESYFTDMNVLSNMSVHDGWVCYLLKLYESYQIRMMRTDGTDDHRVGDVANVLDHIDGMYVSDGSGLITVLYSNKTGNFSSVILPDAQ